MNSVNVLPVGELLDQLKGRRFICPDCLIEMSGPHISLHDGLYLKCSKCGKTYDAMYLLEEPVEVELEFEPLAEVWSTYHLSDGTKLKVRPILLNTYLLLQPGDPFLKLRIDRASTVIVPQHLRGTPGKTPHSPEFLKKMKKKAVEVTEKVEPWSSYLLQTGDGIKIKLQAIQISRIEAYDEMGKPYYEVITEMFIEPFMRASATC